MPFTPSHAVVALPFARGPLARSGLVPAAIAVGAMTPDLPLFVRATPLTYAVTHDLRWLPVTVLVALGLLLVWRCVLRPAARELSPHRLARRLPEAWDAGAGASWRETFAPGRPRSGILLLLLSLVLGVVTHVLWDAFTHEGRAGSALVPALAADWGPLAGYRWLQHGSSVVGLAILAVAALVWLRGRSEVPAPRILPAAVRIAWWLSLPLVLAVGTGLGYAALGPFDAAFTPQHLAYRVVPPLCALWGVATVVLCVTVQVRRRSVRSRADRPVDDARERA